MVASVQQGRNPHFGKIEIPRVLKFISYARRLDGPFFLFASSVGLRCISSKDIASRFACVNVLKS